MLYEQKKMEKKKSVMKHFESEKKNRILDAIFPNLRGFCLLIILKVKALWRRARKKKQSQYV